jgi:hypothetical protein
MLTLLLLKRQAKAMVRRKKEHIDSIYRIYIVKLDSTFHPMHMTCFRNMLRSSLHHRIRLEGAAAEHCDR